MSSYGALPSLCSFVDIFPSKFVDTFPSKFVIFAAILQHHGWKLLILKGLSSWHPACLTLA